MASVLRRISKVPMSHKSSVGLHVDCRLQAASGDFVSLSKVVEFINLAFQYRVLHGDSFATLQVKLVIALLKVNVS